MDRKTVIIKKNSAKKAYNNYIILEESFLYINYIK